MENPYKSFIEETRWGLDSKESQKQALYKKYLSLHNKAQQDLYVQELIKQLEDVLELNALIYENNFNETEVIGYGEF